MLTSFAVRIPRGTPDLEGGFLSALTPLVLTTDTLVTNHGFRDGEANPFPAVLQAGTAVLVDAEGIPRVKCNCGNPLAPPPPDVGLEATTGDPWPGYQAGTTTVITAAPDPLADLTVFDTTTGDTYQQPPGTKAPAEPLDLANIVLPAGSCGEGTPAIQLMDGSGSFRTFRDIEHVSLSVSDLSAPMDVDGDGSEETVLQIYCSFYGHGRPQPFVVALRPVRDADPMLAGDSLPIGPSAGSGFSDSVGRLGVSGDEFLIDVLAHGPNDGNGAPSVPLTLRYRWQDGRWVEVR